MTRHQFFPACPPFVNTGDSINPRGTPAGGPCLVPRPHYYARPMRFGSRGPRKFLRPRQTREVRQFVSLGAELLEACELSITFPR